MEPEWTKAIPSETVCNFFYFFFVLYAVIAIFGIIAVVYTAVVAKNIPKMLFLPLILQGLLPTAVAVVGALFHYLVCSRALLSGEKA
jgi:hypothetical protein